MTSQFGRQYLPPVFRLDPVSYRAQPIIHLSAFCREFLTTRPATHLKLASTGPVAIVRKTQKVKRIGLAVLCSGIFPFKVAKR